MKLAERFATNHNLLLFCVMGSFKRSDRIKEIAYEKDDKGFQK